MHEVKSGGAGFGVESLGCRGQKPARATTGPSVAVKSGKLRVRGLDFQFWGFGIGVWSLGFGVWGLGSKFGVEGCERRKKRISTQQ